MTRRTRGVALPLLLIAIGLIFLLVNTGVLSADALQRLGDLWPLLLVIVGLQLVFNHTLPRQRAQLAGLVAAALILLAGVGYAITAPATQVGGQHQESSEALGSLTSATFDLSYSGATTEVQSADLGDQLFKAQVDYPNGEQPPDISLDRQAGSLEISGGRSSAFHLFQGSQPRHIAVILTTRIPWSVQVSGGAAAIKLQLFHLTLTRLEISGGASRLDVGLPKPRGNLPVDLSGGASAVTLRAPSGTEWKVSLSGGVSYLSINGSQFGGLGSLDHQSHGYASAGDRLTVTVSGGVSHVDLVTN